MESIAKVAQRVIEQAPMSQVERQKQLWNERVKRGELLIGGEWHKRIQPSEKDLEAARNAKPGVPEIAREDAARPNPKAKMTPEKTTVSTEDKVLMPTKESPHVLHWVTPNTTHVTMSETDRKARVAALEARSATDSYESALAQFAADWRAWEQANIAHMIYLWPAPAVTIAPDDCWKAASVQARALVAMVKTWTPLPKGYGFKYVEKIASDGRVYKLRAI